MNSADICLALAKVPPFVELSREERATIVSVSRLRSYAPGEVLLRPGRVPTRGLVLLSGTITGSTLTMPGWVEVLLSQEPSQPVVAGEAGAVCLLFSRGHLFTIAYECPTLLAWLLKATPPVAGGSS